MTECNAKVTTGPLHGLRVIESDSVPRGTYYVMPDAIAMHWIDRSMLSFDHAQWWGESPAQSARRIVNEVLTHHGYQPLPAKDDR